MTIEEALELIPTHIILRKNKDRWQEGDEVFLGNSWSICKFKTDSFTYKGEKEFTRIFHGQHGWTDLIKNENVNFNPAQRAIPESVRNQMAQNISNWSLNSNFDEVNPFEGWLESTQGERK